QGRQLTLAFRERWGYPQAMLTRPLPIWIIRLHLAALLIFCSQAILWQIDGGAPWRGALHWLLTLPLAALLLDLAVRFRVRDLFGALLLAGLYGLLSALAVHPAYALVELPVHLATRALGAHALAALAAWGLLLWLSGVGRGGWLLFGFPAGVIAGLWARWQPFAGGEAVSPVMFGATLSVGLALIGLLTAWAQRHTAGIDARALRLTPIEASATALSLGAAVAGWLGAGVYNPLTLALCAGLGALCAAALWFHKRARGAAHVDRLTQFAPRWRWLALGAASLMAGAAVGWLLPRGVPVDPPALIGALLTAFGIVWLPTTALVLGLRALQRETRALRL
ncbi:MAG: hypothetical protein NZM00_14420, partial [Anaerolinea sp.]|nr:hypothetical protein [Anaerolinea sp.]